MSSQTLDHNCKCGQNDWIITIRQECDGCPDNDSEVEDGGECSRGPAHGAGCWILTCKECSLEDYLPFVDQ